MLTNEESEYLLQLEKTLLNPNQVIDLSEKRHTVELISHQDTDYRFRIDILTNKKVLLKTSIHHMESNSFIGLLRIDFKGGHKNPDLISDTVPDKLKPFAGKWFEPDEPHMHIYVENYRPLVWAIPLKETNFPIKEIKEQADVSDLILNFGKRINIKSKIIIQQAGF